MLFRRTFATLFALALLGMAVPSSAGSNDAPAVVTIAYQPGIGYSNLIVMKQSGALERRFPGTKFEWRVLANGATIRDGFLAGQIQIGAGGTSPFLIGWDRGVGYKLIGSLNEMSLWLVSRDPKIHTLKDFGADAKIGMPAPDSIQAMVLRRGAQEQLGNPHALDTNIVAIEHPLGLAALAGGQLQGHFGAPPFQQQEVESGGHIVLKSFDVMGKSSFNNVYTTDAFAREHPGFVSGFYSELFRATKLINNNVDKAAEYLSKDTDGKVSAATFKRYLTAPDVTFTIVPHGFMKLARFMKDNGFLSKMPESVKDLELSMLHGVGD